MVVSLHVAAGNRTQDLWKNSQWAISPAPMCVCFKTASCCIALTDLYIIHYSKWQHSVVPSVKIKSYFIFYFSLVFQTVFLCSTGCSGTHSLGHAGLKVRDPPASAGVKGLCHHHPTLIWNSCYVRSFLLKVWENYRTFWNSLKC